MWRIQEALILQDGSTVILVDDGVRGSDRLWASLHQEDLASKLFVFAEILARLLLGRRLCVRARDIIVSLDGDLQTIRWTPRLVAKLDAGYDPVNGWRVDRQDPFWRRRLPSQIANSIISLTTESNSTITAAPQRFRRDVAKNLKLYGEMHRFIPALVSDLGGKVTEVPVAHHPRQRGSSKYGLARTLWVILDLLTVKFLSNYATRPSHLFGLLGVLSSLLGGAITILLGLQKVLFNVRLANRPLLLLGVLLIVLGVQFISMGLIGEMLARTYHESQEKPIYMVKDVLE
jgi:hypothetical protein